MPDPTNERPTAATPAERTAPAVSILDRLDALESDPDADFEPFEMSDTAIVDELLVVADEFLGDPDDFEAARERMILLVTEQKNRIIAKANASW